MQPKKALDTLYQSNQYDQTIFKHYFYMENYTTAFQEISIFQSSENLIEIVEFSLRTGKLTIELDQPLKYGLILDSSDFEISEKAEYLSLNTNSPGQLHYMFGSSDRPFVIALILYRPENVQNQKVLLKMDYTNEYASNGNKIEHVDLTDESSSSGKMSVTEIVTYSLIGTGALIILVSLVGLICYLKKPKKEAIDPPKLPSDKSDNSEKYSVRLNESRKSNLTSSTSKQPANESEFLRVETK